MRTLKDYWWLLLVLLIVTLIFIINNESIMEPLKWTGKPFEVLGKLVVKLVVVGALLDQLIAVFFPESLDTKSQRNEAETTLSINREKRRAIRKEILQERLNFRDGPRTESFRILDEDLSNTDHAIRAAQEVLGDFDSKRVGFVRMVAFAFSLVLATAGITVLSEFIVMHNENNEVELNHKIIYYLDIILTAALISGGTSGIDQFFKVIRDAWKRNDINQ